MDFTTVSTNGNVSVVQNSEREYAVIDKDNAIVVPFGKYQWIDRFDNGLCRVRGKGRLTYCSNILAILADGKVYDRQEVPTVIQKECQEHPEQFAKWGIINEHGEEVLPMEYDSVWNFAGKGRVSTRVEKGSEYFEAYFSTLLNKEQFILPSNDYDDSYDDDYYGSHYGEFAGTYAQDIMGYSDDVINDAFDGDPDAYWNID